MAELAQRAGIPAGVFNVVTGDAVAIGGEFTGNDKVRKVSFTGSTAVGKLLMAQCAGTVKKVALELGGNAPFLVLDDADLDAAVHGRHPEQVPQHRPDLRVRQPLHRAVEDLRRIHAEARPRRCRKLRVGDGLKGETDQGPLIDAKALAKVEEHIADAQAKGATVVTGGKRHALGGTFYEPTVLTNVSANMTLAREETFGPVAPLFRVDTDEEAVRLANDTEFGLAAYVYTRDLARSWRVTEALEYGIVGLNTGLISTEVAPFGGVKESGIGREGSKYGILEFTELKYICVGGI